MFKISKIKNNVFLQNFIFMHEILNHYHIRLSKISKKCILFPRFHMYTDNCLMSEPFFQGFLYLVYPFMRFI